MNTTLDQSTDPSTVVHEKSVQAGGLNIAYREAGAGKGGTVLLIHGWPTSSFLWRNIMPAIAQSNHVLALDLPGFGKSDKPLDQQYNFRFFSQTIDAFLEKLEINAVNLGVHDLGGPVGLFWLANNMERVGSLAILNTLVYPEFSWAVKAFIAALKLPLVRDLTASPLGLRLGMRIGIQGSDGFTDEMLAGTQAPFVTAAARQALLKAGGDLAPRGFAILSQRLKNYKGPVHIVYGDRDRILPDIKQTVRRLQNDLPQATVTCIENCGHFLQEDRPKEVASALAPFFAKAPRP